jgi:ribosomal protein S18 acetylase RimI-like enzyme
MTERRCRQSNDSLATHFRLVGSDSVAEDEPASIDSLAVYTTAKRARSAVGGSDRPVGYVLVDVVDGNAHIEKISVRPNHQGAGAGPTDAPRASLGG